MNQRKFIYNETIIIVFNMILFISFIFVVSLSIVDSSPKILLSIIALLLILNLFLFRNEWRSQYIFIKKATILTGISSAIFLAIYFITQHEIFFTLAQLLSIGIISVLLFLPIVFDQFLRIISISKNISSFSEAMVLYRNILSGNTKDFIIGLRSSQRCSDGNIRNYFYRIILLAITLIGRIPQINDDLLVSASIRHFSIDDVKSLYEFKYLKSIVIFLLTVILIIFEGELNVY